ncbi:uncharacterized protein si:ch211-191i18.2 [Anabas testudineus]|uniref:uncharacterized protein si:ch211-191i18.2 n=1 Tax=Anabas testudineus TaxID=64144 RepID=UPI00143D4084|nr:uncharacterized protein si:ch211-191i18.2 [Anabas testudineus]
MSSCRFLCLSGFSVILLLLQSTGSEAEQLDLTPPPDYDYNATFEYSFFSNGSSEDLDKFSERFGDPDEEEETVTTVTTGGNTESGAASLHVSQEIWALVWTLMILNLQQLQPTL